MRYPYLPLSRFFICGAGFLELCVIGQLRYFERKQQFGVNFKLYLLSAATHLPQVTGVQDGSLRKFFK